MPLAMSSLLRNQTIKTRADNTLRGRLNDHLAGLGYAWNQYSFRTKQFAPDGAGAAAPVAAAIQDAVQCQNAPGLTWMAIAGTVQHMAVVQVHSNIY